MNPAVEQKIRKMIVAAPVGAEQQTLEVLAGWQRLFESQRLDDAQQEAQFDFVMLARGADGRSVAAPAFWEPDDSVLRRQS